MLGKKQIEMLRFACRNRGWQSFAPDVSRIVLSLQKRGLLEVVGTQFRYVDIAYSRPVSLEEFADEAFSGMVGPHSHPFDFMQDVLNSYCNGRSVPATFNRGDETTLSGLFPTLWRMRLNRTLAPSMMKINCTKTVVPNVSFMESVK